MKRAISLILCAVLCAGLAPVALAKEQTIRYAAVTATQPDYSDATVVLLSDSSWESAKDSAANMDNCAFVVIYSPCAEVEPPTLTADIELSSTEPGLILSNVVISGSARADNGLYLFGGASVKWGSVTLTGVSQSGDSLPALTEDFVNNTDCILSGFSQAKIRHTYTDSAEIGMLAAYDLVVDNDAHVRIGAPKDRPEGDDFHHILTIERSLTVHGLLDADDGQELQLLSGTWVTGLSLYEEDGQGGCRPFDFDGGATESFLFNSGAEYASGSGETVTGLWVRLWGGGNSDPGPNGSPGAFERFHNLDSGEYLINENTTITPEDSVFLNAGTVTVAEDITLTVAAGGRLELCGMEATNSGNIVVEPDARFELRSMALINHGTIVIEPDDLGSPPEHGRFELRDNAVLTNNGLLDIAGNAELLGAELKNNGTVILNGFLRLALGAILTNEGTVTGRPRGIVMLDNPSDADAPLKITGLDFYDNPEDTEATGDWNGEFVYHDLLSKWVRNDFPGPGEDDPEGDGSWHTVTVIHPVNGTISAEGLNDGEVQVLDRDTLVFTIVPEDGYIVLSVFVTHDSFVDDQSWNLRYVGDGIFEFPLEHVESDLTLEVIFREEDPQELLDQNYVVLLEDTDSADNLKPILLEQFGMLGYTVSPDEISVRDINASNIADDGYGTFRFTVTLGTEESVEKTGYIVQSPSDVIFRLCDESGNEKIRVANEEAARSGEFGVPAMHRGTMEIFGLGNLVAAPLNPDLASSMVDGKVQLPFYRAQFHIFSFSTGLNLYGFYVIQEDAYCVHVSARSGHREQSTPQWDLDRYADLTEGSYTSEVFFGNDEFILALPRPGIGGVDELSLETGDFPGYTVHDNGDGSYSVHFLSDYYDRITIALTINGDIPRQLHIHRVGVHIEEYVWKEGPPSCIVFHGTQYGTLIDFSDNNQYRVYGTYYIPDYGTRPPYGLYATYTWQDGSKTTEVITEPCSTPTPVNTDFSNGVFFYGDPSANCCDYLLYSAPNGSNAPVKISVTVLKADPTATGSFGGVFLGSGAGVTWTRVQ